MSCQKVVNVLAVASFAVSGAVVASGLYVYVNRTSIIDGVKSQVIESVLGGLGGGLGGGAVVPEVGSGIPTGSEKAEAYDSPKTSPSTDFGL